MTSFWTDKRVMVTGANGFIGRHLCRTLTRSGAEVLKVDNHSFGTGWYVEKNLADKPISQEISTHDIQVVFHLAGAPGVSFCDMEPEMAFDANVRATENVLSSARWNMGLLEEYQSLSSLVTVSSNHVYGEQSTKPTPEDAPLNGRGTYAATKIAADVMAQCYGKTHGVPVGIARITNSYGPDDHHAEHLITSTIKRLLDDKQPELRNPQNSKGYLYIADTVSGLMALAEGIADGRAGYGEAFNIAPNLAHSSHDVVQIIKSCMGYEHIRIPAEHGKWTAFAPCAPSVESEHLSIDKAREVLGWRPQYGLSEGLAETIAWYREQHAAKATAGVTE